MGPKGHGVKMDQLVCVWQGSRFMKVHIKLLNSPKEVRMPLSAHVKTWGFPEMERLIL